MKRFLRNLLLMLLPFLAGALALLWIPLPRHWAYNHAAKDCRHAGWINRRITEDSLPVDVAIIGSSRTLCAVNDSLLDMLLAQQGMALHVANLSLCRFGRDGQSAVLADLLVHHRPKWVVVEVNEREPFHTHLSYPALAAPGQLLDPVSPLNRDYFKNIWQGIEVRHRYVQERIWGSTVDTVPDPQLHGFLHIPGYEFIPQEQAKEFDSNSRPAGTPGGTVRKRMDWEYAASKAFLSRMVADCKAAGAQVAFLYLPSYSNRAAVPEEMELYQQMGRVWMPPLETWNDHRWWRDQSHLNEEATARLTTWMAGKFQEN